MKTTRNIFIGIVALAILIGGCFGLIALSTYAVGYFVRGTRPIPGDADKFDVLATYPDIVKFAGDNMQLIDINMTYVKSDGTLDLTANYGANVDYHFVRVLDSAPNSTVPLGAGGNTSGTYAEDVIIEIQKPEAKGGSRDQYYNFGMSRIDVPSKPLTEKIIPEPACTAKQLWDIAIKHDAPANAVATIDYDSSGYTFSIKDTSVFLHFDATCDFIN